MATSESIRILISAKNNAIKELNKTRKTLKKNGEFTKQYSNRLDKARKAQQRLNSVTNLSRREFKGWALSIMFAGMAIKRAFDMIWKSSMKTFNEVHANLEGSTTGFTKLQGSMKYLWFSVGQALEPLAEAMIPIVERISEWVQANPKLVQTLTALAGVLGTLFTVGGMGVLAVEGFKSMAADMVVMSKVKLPKFQRLANLLAIPVSSTFPVALAGIAALGAIAWKAFSETPEAWDALKEAVQTMKDSEAVKGLIKSLENLVQEVMPDFEMNWENIAWTIAWAVETGIKAIEQLFSAISTVINAVLTLVDGIQLAIAWIDKMFAKLSGTEPSEFAKGYDKKLSDMKNSVENLSSSWDTLTGKTTEYGKLLDEGAMGYKSRKLIESGRNIKPLEDQSEITQGFLNRISSDSDFRNYLSEQGSAQTLNLTVNVDGEKTTIRKILDSTKNFQNVNITPTG